MLKTPVLSYRLLTVAGLLVPAIMLLGFYALHVDQAAWEVSFVRDVQTDLSILRPISIMLTVAGAGLPWLLVVSGCGAALWLRGARRLVPLLAAVFAMQFIGTLLKVLIGRARPSDLSVDVWQHLSSASFPSGHVLSATLVFGFLFFALEHCTVPAALRWPLQVACLAWMLLMGIARMQLGAHWPTDVLGGYLVGALLLTPVVLAMRRSAPQGESSAV